MKVTKWSTHPGELTVSQQQAEQTPTAVSSESDSVAGEPAVSASGDAQNKPVAVSAPEPLVESATIVPDHEVPGANQPVNVKASKTHETKVELHKADTKPAAELPKGKLLIMSPGDRTWREPKAGLKSSFEGSGKRRLSALAAVAALGIIAGAFGSALATGGMTRIADAGAATSPSGNAALEAAVARIDADIVALKAGLEQTSKAGVSQFNKTSDRLERIEKAQAEPTAKLAKLSEAVEKLRATQQLAPAAAVTTAAATPKDVTGSITLPQGAAPLPMPAAPATVAAATPKTEVGRLPTVDGWSLADVGYGGALIRNQNRRGVYEVYAGDFIPGLGRIDAIRKQDGHWVVVTSKGLIVAR